MISATADRAMHKHIKTLAAGRNTATEAHDRATPHQRWWRQR